MSPLQFRKQLRLQGVRRLMHSKNFDAAEAGYKVGYDDASHFSRECRPNFGEPPIRNVEKPKEAADMGFPIRGLMRYLFRFLVAWKA